MFPFDDVMILLEEIITRKWLSLSLDLFFKILLFQFAFLVFSAILLLYPPYPKDRGMLWFYVETARRPQWC